MYSTDIQYANTNHIFPHFVGTNKQISVRVSLSVAASVDFVLNFQF